MKEQNQNSRAHDLLLLMFNLSQITLKEKIIDVFVGALGNIWPDSVFVYRQIKPDPAESSFEISASGSNYGYICIEKSAEPENEELALLYNATAMLAVIIKKNEQAELLLQGKTEEIAAQNEEYQAINEELIQTNQELAQTKEIAENSVARLKMAMEVSDSGAWDWDMLNNTFYWSDEFLQLFGLPKNTIAGFDAWTKALHPDDVERASKNIREAIENRTELLNEYRIILPNKEIRWMRSTGHVSYVDAKPARMIGVCLDVTDQKTAEQLILESQARLSEALEASNQSRKTLLSVLEDQRRSEKNLIIAKEHAEESDRLKSAFLANMSHEIRTPMNGILGFASLLKEPNLTGEEQQKYIRIIEKSGARMLNIINDIVDISKIEAGLMEVNLKESNINDQIEYIYTFFKPEVENKGIRLFFKNQLPAKEAIIETDREKIYAILTNLVKNAIKYTNEGSIEFGYTLVGTHHGVSLPHESFLQFYVKDTGIGIAKNRQEAIFERFIQADIEDTMAQQGAGLGLAITKAYVEMLGGIIRVESEPGKGSIFYFTIPYNTKKQEQCAVTNVVSQKDESDQMRILKILIAEDDETSDLLITTMLKINNYQVLHVHTGDQAIETCRINPDIDLVLMDIRMPGMNGYEATRQIRQFNKDVIIIAQTAYGLSGDRENAIESGCNDYISKPINRGEFVQLIKKYFNK